MSKLFAQISGNVVINTLVAETIEDAQLAVGGTCVEFTAENPASIGCIYDAATGIFTAPKEPTI